MATTRPFLFKLFLPANDVVNYTTSAGVTKTMLNATINYPYTGDARLQSLSLTITGTKPDASSFDRTDVVGDVFNIDQDYMDWSQYSCATGAYAYTSTRGSLILLNGTTVLNNNSKSVSINSSFPGETNYLSFGPFANPNVRTLINATRGGSGADNRRFTIYAGYVFVYLFGNASIYDYYYFYYAINNATRGSMSSGLANGALSKEGTTVSVEFTPFAGYYLDYINDTVAGNVSVNSSSPYTYSLASYATRTVTGYFGAYTYYLTLNSSTGGSVSANVTSGTRGFNSLVTFTPAFAYELEYITVGASNIPASSIVNNQYTVSNITENVSLYAKFRRSSNMQACIGGVLKRLDMYACIGGVLKPINTKFCIGGVLKQ